MSSATFAYYLDTGHLSADKPDADRANVFAAWCCHLCRPVMVEGFGAVYQDPNSPVAWTQARRSVLDPPISETNTSETKARGLHPRLFKRIARD